MIRISRSPVVLLVLAVLAAMPMRVAAQDTPVGLSPEVRAALAEGDAVRVIVRVRQAYQVEGRLDRPAVQAQRTRLRA